MRVPLLSAFLLSRLLEGYPAEKKRKKKGSYYAAVLPPTKIESFLLPLTLYLVYFVSTGRHQRPSKFSRGLVQSSSLIPTFHAQKDAQKQKIRSKATVMAMS